MGRMELETCTCKCHPVREICRVCCVRAAKDEAFGIMMKQNETVLELQEKLGRSETQNDRLATSLKESTESLKKAGDAMALLLDDKENMRKQRDSTNADKMEILKEAKFRLELADLWVSQLRGVLQEAMDALAADPDHDVSLQAKLELTRRAVSIPSKPKAKKKK